MYNIGISGPPLSYGVLSVRCSEVDTHGTLVYRRAAQKFKFNDEVTISEKFKSKFNKGVIVGVEWGGDNTNINRDIWCYWVKDLSESNAPDWILIPEDQLEGVT